MPSKKMHIYIDESGDTGIKFDKGSSKLFVVSLLCVKNENLSDLENRLDEIKNSLKIYQKELKFSHLPFNKKVLFYKKLKDTVFQADIFIFKKNFKEDFSYFIIKSLANITHIFSKTEHVKIIIDGMDKNKLNHNDIKVIRNIFAGIKVRISFADSKKDILLQMSDMLAGLAHSTHNYKFDYKHSLQSIEHKIKTTLIE